VHHHIGWHRNVQALSPAVTSFVKFGRTWKLGDPIYSTGVGALKKKEMVQSFGDAFATAQLEGVFMGRGSGQKYRANIGVQRDVNFSQSLHRFTLVYSYCHFLINDANFFGKNENFFSINVNFFCCFVTSDANFFVNNVNFSPLFAN
jgi:hypothetical protein